MKYKVAILGARGLVGQWLLYLLSRHPWFEVSAITSSRYPGARYGEVTNWFLNAPIPKELAGLELQPSDPGRIDADIVFSALPAEAARMLEPEFAAKGFTVISKASAYRLHDKVPLIIPEVNPEHLALLETQKELWSGALVTDPNCTTSILVLPLKVIDDLYGVNKVVVTTLQSVSGAGYPGVSSYDIIDNIVPFIKGEEDKVAREARKILGRLEGSRIVEAGFEVAATCTRVPILEGHLESVYIEARERVAVDEVVDAFREFRGRPQEMKLPTAPREPIIVVEARDRPQPRLDRMHGDVPGMSVTVGRIRPGPDARSLLFLVLGHNLVRGAAGSAVLLAEMMVAEDVI